MMICITTLVQNPTLNKIEHHTADMPTTPHPHTLKNHILKAHTLKYICTIIICVQHYSQIQLSVRLNIIQLINIPPIPHTLHLKPIY